MSNQLDFHEVTNGMTPAEIGRSLAESNGVTFDRLEVSDYEHCRVLTWRDSLSDNYYIVVNGDVIDQTTEKRYVHDSAPDGTDVSYSIVGTNSGSVVYRSNTVTSNSGSYVSSIPGLVAFWDFSRAGYLTARGGDTSLTLTPIGAAITQTDDVNAPLGGYITLNGAQRMEIPSENTGPLRLGTTTGECTVIGWVNRAAENNMFIAGCWRENNNDPQRVYGLFVDLPVYGGGDSVCGHISTNGGATPGYPFSVDYSASPQRISGSNSGWQMVAFTYDGYESKAYVNGLFDEYPSYTDSNNNTYSKNPYIHPSGMNTATDTDFTIGAVELTGSYGNHFNGKISGVAVFDRALTQDELISIREKTDISSAINVQTSSFEGPEDISKFGSFRSWYKSTAIETTNDYAAGNWGAFDVDGVSFFYTSSTIDFTGVPSMFIYEAMPEIEVSEISAYMNNNETTDSVRLCVQVNGEYYASDEEFTANQSGSNSDWTNETMITASVKNDLFRKVTLNTGVELSLAASAYPLPSTAVTGVGVYCYSPTGAVRIRRIDLH